MNIRRSGLPGAGPKFPELDPLAREGGLEAGSGWSLQGGRHFPDEAGSVVAGRRGVVGRGLGLNLGGK